MLTMFLCIYALYIFFITPDNYLKIMGLSNKTSPNCPINLSSKIDFYLYEQGLLFTGHLHTIVELITYWR